MDRNVNTGWGTPLVPVPKADGSVRLAADYRITVNPQLMGQKHPLPTPEELFVRIKGKRFCKLDLKDAYLQMELDQASKDMTTVTTHKGLLRMNRLPFGISTCGDIFQAAMDRILEGLDGCVNYLDDLLVMGDTEEEMLKSLDRVLARLKEHGVRLKGSKCQFNLKEVTYLGWLISGTDLKPVSEKIEALLKMPEPKNVSELRALLGSLNYYQKLIPNMATILAPLHSLLKKEVKWKWNQECKRAMEEIQQVLSSDKVLMRYDPLLPIKLITDASSVGVGAVLVHVLPDGLERPVSYSSRTLTTTERKYSVLEKEALAVSFGVKKFHQYLYGRRFCLVTDNRALSLILNPQRELPSLAAARMQRYALQLAAHSYEVELRRTKDMGIADTLSRLPASADQEEEDEWCPQLVMNAENEGPTLHAKEVEIHTRRDALLGRVLQYVRAGWPATVEPEMKPFFQRRDELSTQGDCVVWGGRLAVPKKLRKRVLDELHTGHMGSSKMKQLARRHLWWPGLDRELENLARSCAACVEKRADPPKSVLHPWERTTGPWERIHADFAGPFQGTMLLIVSDSFSKWIEVVTMRSTTAERTVEELRKLFARHGLPVQIVTDNGTQFTSEEFAKFTRMNGIKHIRVAPFHPKSNGAAEKAVQTVKNGLQASQGDGGSVEQRLARFLMNHRSTPVAVTGKTPAELLYGRNIRTRLDLMRPDDGRAAKWTQKMVDDAGGRHRLFHEGQEVWARSYSGPKWKRGKILAKTGPVSYEVDVGAAVWSRHADQLLHAGEETEDEEKTQERRQGREDGKNEGSTDKRPEKMQDDRDRREERREEGREERGKAEKTREERTVEKTREEERESGPEDVSHGREEADGTVRERQEKGGDITQNREDRTREETRKEGLPGELLPGPASQRGDRSGDEPGTSAQPLRRSNRVRRPPDRLAYV